MKKEKPKKQPSIYKEQALGDKLDSKPEFLRYGINHRYGKQPPIRLH